MLAGYTFGWPAGGLTGTGHLCQGLQPHAGPSLLLQLRIGGGVGGTPALGPMEADACVCVWGGGVSGLGASVAWAQDPCRAAVCLIRVEDWTRIPKVI
jgi:hypothetical protein